MPSIECSRLGQAARLATQEDAGARGDRPASATARRETARPPKPVVQRRRARLVRQMRRAADRGEQDAQRVDRRIAGSASSKGRIERGSRPGAAGPHASRISIAAASPSASRRSAASPASCSAAAISASPSALPSALRSRGRSIGVVDIARIVDPADAPPAQKVAQGRAPRGKQRPDDPDLSVEQRRRRHAGKAAPACRAPAASARSRPGRRRYGRSARGRCLPRRAAWPAARSAPRARRRAGRWRASRRSRPGSGGRCRGSAQSAATPSASVGRARPQPMVDGHGHQPRAGRGPVEMIFQEEKQRGGIAAARNRGDDAARARQDRSSEKSRASIDAGRACQHAASACSCLTRSFSAPEMSGIALADFREGRAGDVALVEPVQRHAELQQHVRRLLGLTDIPCWPQGRLRPRRGISSGRAALRRARSARRPSSGRPGSARCGRGSRLPPCRSRPTG